VLVLTVHDHNGLNQVRTLGRLGVPVYLTHPPGRPAASRSRYAAGRFPWDIHAHTDAETVRFLLDKVAPAIGEPAIVVPGEDRSAIFLAEHAEALAPSFVSAVRNGELVRRLVDKGGLRELCAATGTPTPRTQTPVTREDVERFAAEATFPVVVKARHGWRLNGTGDVPTVIAETREELIAAVDRLSAGGAPEAILQEYVPGGADAVWLVNGYAGRDGRVRLLVPANKLREYPVDRGLTSFGVTRENPTVVAIATNLVESVGYSGPFDIELRFDARDGSYNVIDFNPRAGANFRLCVDGNGLDSIRAAYLDLTDQPVQRAPLRAGRRWIAEHVDVLAARRYIAEGRIGPREYLRSLRDVEEAAWWARDDPAPFAFMLRDLAGVALAWTGRRARAAWARRFGGTH
jgi:predicted ATP-grasp superfamily ATP-dependent carboligase